MYFSIKYETISNIESDTAQFKLNINEVRVVWGGGGVHTLNEPTFLLSCPLKGDCNRNSHESLSLKLAILAIPVPPREETQVGSIHISCEPPQHVVMLANRI